MPTLTSTPVRAGEERTARVLDFIQRVDPDADPTSILLFWQVRKTGQLLTRSVEKELEAAGLSWPKFLLLLVLLGNETNGADGGMEPSELSDLQGIPRNTVSELLAGLEEQGLISRALHGTDRRRFVIRLTPQGRKIVRTNLRTQSRQITERFRALGARERATLLEHLTRLSQSLSETNE
jgi:DNA-binding MarR family transcriptional regulator